VSRSGTLAGASEAARLALVLPVPEADDLATAVRLRHNQERTVPQVRNGATFAHLSLAGPLPPEDLSSDLLQALANTFAAVPPFAYVLKELRHFDGGILYLAPDPVAPFADLMRRSVRCIDPEATGPPADRSVPHVTMAYEATTAERVGLITSLVHTVVPIPAMVREAHLVLIEPALRTLIHRFPLGNC
jgi:hypothetical protein